MDQEQRELQNVDNTLPKNVISSYAFNREQHTQEAHCNKNGGPSLSDSPRTLVQEALSQSTRDIFAYNKKFDSRAKRM